MTTETNERMDELFALARRHADDEASFWNGLLDIAERDVRVEMSYLASAEDLDFARIARSARKLASAAELLAGEGR
jgi:hypothetical protein